MDEHDDDLASEVIEGEEIETDTFDAEGEPDERSADHQNGADDDAPDEGGTR